MVRKRIVRGAVAMALDEPIAYAGDVLPDQSGTQIHKRVRRVVKRSQDRLAFNVGKPEDVHAGAVGLLETVGELFAIHEAGELKEGVVGEVDAREEHDVVPDWWIA